MKKSEELRQEANKLDNDLAYLGAMNKVMREERFERALPWLDELKKAPKVISIDQDASGTKFTINTEKFGIIDYFPKANKVLIRKQNSWKTGGLSWLRTNILKK
jgi:hypothetical protein